jgi:SAM-dependent methyltransferase
MNRGPAATATIELSLAVKAPEGVLIDDRGRAHPFSGWIEFASAIEDWRLAGARPPAAVVEDQGTRLLPSQPTHHQKEKALAMTTMTVNELKRTHRATWAAGDYAAVAELIDEAPPRDLLTHVDVTPGLEVLDVATGTGNIAIRAAARGARVVGLDLTPELFEPARRRASEHGVEVEWVEGDTEELPFADESFDLVTSAFGVQFAPRHEIVAGELVRVLRPSGRIGLVNWTPQGLIGELLKTIGSYMPAPPDYASPPPLWGSEQHLRRLFAGAAVELEFARGHNPWRFDSAEQFVAFMETRYGPTLKARERLTAAGRWAECRAEIVALAERHNESTDDDLLMRAEYLVAVVDKASS